MLPRNNDYTRFLIQVAGFQSFSSLQAFVQCLERVLISHRLQICSHNRLFQPSVEVLVRSFIFLEVSQVFANSLPWIDQNCLPKYAAEMSMLPDAFFESSGNPHFILCYFIKNLVKVEITVIFPFYRIRKWKICSIAIAFWWATKAAFDEQLRLQNIFLNSGKLQSTSDSWNQH